MNQPGAVTYRSLLDDATQLLYDISDTPRIDAEVLMQHAIEQPMAWLIAYGDSIASSKHIEDFFSMIAERQTGKPIAYITGSREFWTLNLRVNEHVLIPRPDTETLVENALSVLDKNDELSILDLGTGSGAIALSIAKERPNSSVLALDAHQAALDVAQDNAKRHALSNVKFLLSDWYSALNNKSSELSIEEPHFDLIASNPPYIDATDEHLQQGDLRFEPNTALVANNDGLSDIEHIIRNAKKFLKRDAYLIIEHGYNQQAAVAQLFEHNGFQNIVCHQDINHLPRCTIGQIYG